MILSINLIRRLIMFSLTTCTILVIGVIYYMEFELPDIHALNTVQLQVPLQIYTRDHQLIATFGEKHRVPITYDRIPTPLIQAVLATEDQRYFKHNGVDLPGLGRATLQLLATGKKLQGGSTITMQVARSFYLTRNKTFARKVREILLAIKIEHELSKEKILELYLNKVFFGNRAYGVEAAAEVYYGKHLNQLSIDQYAMLAGLPKAPSQLNPLANKEAAEKRRNHVLARMFDQGYINRETFDKAIQAPLKASYHDLQTEVKAPDIAELVREQLEHRYGDEIYTDGYKVITTLDSHLQQTAVKAVYEHLLAYDQRHGYRGPTEHLTTPSDPHMENWTNQLRQMPIINGLEPAAVISLTDNTATVLRQEGERVVIPWEGLSWARKPLEDGEVGPRPQHAKDILQVGDVIRIMPTPEGWRLAQIPKAEAGLVALDPQNGAILALVGGFDYQTSKFNRITRAERQPGSSFKPFIYSAALDKGLTLATVVNDAPLVIENPNDGSLWRPQNDTRKFYGPTRLRTAIIKSRNLVTIRTLASIGLPYTINYLHRFGFEGPQLPPGLSLALGTGLMTPLQLAKAYAIFANGGMRVTPFAIDTVMDAKNQVIYQASPLTVCANSACDNQKTAAPRVISAENAFLITSALRDVIEHGTAKLAKNLGRHDLAGKTGTTQNQVDAWFAGYNPDIVTIAWMGFDQPQSLHEWGSQTALPMWMQFMQSALKDKTERVLPPPFNVVSMRINPHTGRLAADRDPAALSEYFIMPYLPDTESDAEEDGEEEIIN